MSEQARVTSQHYARPHRPIPIALLNRCGSLLSKFGLEPALDEASLIRAARKASGLDHFADDSIRVPLRRLLQAIESEARLHTLGRILVRTNLVRVLAHRLRIQAALDRCPAILEQTLEAPIVIAGLQRTGTTLLHRLFACDPAIRWLASWEAINPAPLSSSVPSARDRARRIRAARLAERGLRYLAPDFAVVHPVEALAPEEDVLLLDYSLISTVPEATQHVPSYSTWLETLDHVPAYRYLEKLLKLLQWQGPRGRWVLKSPHHLEHLDALLEVFPDATVVQTHRDPLRAVASFCSMIAHGRGIFSDRVDPHEVARHWERKALRMLERSMAVREAAPAERFIDVAYTDLLDDPLEQVRRIYERVGVPLKPEVEHLMRGYLAEHPQHKHGRHCYRLEDFGLDPEREEEKFAAYRERFSIAHE